VLWARKYGAAGDEVPYSIATGPDGNLYVAGQLTGACNLGGANVTAAGAADIFIAKYDSIGVHQWSQRYGTAGYSYGYGICVDSGTNIVVTGSFQSSLNFGNGTTFTPMAGSAIFLAKYTSGGANVWPACSAEPVVVQIPVGQLLRMRTTTLCSLEHWYPALPLTKCSFWGRLLTF
jgi:hypothetical protein